VLSHTLGVLLAQSLQLVAGALVEIPRGDTLGDLRVVVSGTHGAQSTRLLLLFTELDLARTRVAIVASRLAPTRPELSIRTPVWTAAANGPIALRAITIACRAVGTTLSIGAIRTLGAVRPIGTV
jgi:hypothetical protein